MKRGTPHCPTGWDLWPCLYSLLACLPAKRECYPLLPPPCLKGPGAVPAYRGGFFSNISGGTNGRVELEVGRCVSFEYELLFDSRSKLFSAPTVLVLNLWTSLTGFLCLYSSAWNSEGEYSPPQPCSMRKLTTIWENEMILGMLKKGHFYNPNRLRITLNCSFCYFFRGRRRTAIKT